MPLNHWFWKRKKFGNGYFNKSKWSPNIKQKFKFSNFETIIIIGHVFRVGIGQKTQNIFFIYKISS